jgi:hypothetical protein
VSVGSAPAPITTVIGAVEDTNPKA